MRSTASKSAWSVELLNLNRNLTRNPFAPESKIKMKITIEMGAA